MRSRLSLIALAALTIGAVRAGTAPAAPDLILYRGRIITVDATDRVAQAIAITGNTITAVGSDAEITKLAGPATRRIDLGGRAVTPGLLDAHAHFASGGADRLFTLDVGYPTVKSIKDVVDSVRARAAALKPGEVLSGRGWTKENLPSIA